MITESKSVNCMSCTDLPTAPIPCPHRYLHALDELLELAIDLVAALALALLVLQLIWVVHVAPATAIQRLDHVHDLQRVQGYPTTSVSHTGYDQKGIVQAPRGPCWHAACT